MEYKGKDISQEQFEDHGKCAQNSGLMKQIDTKNGEKIIFSCLLNKKNKFMFNQDRTLLITNWNLYNVDKSKI